MTTRIIYGDHDDRTLAQLDRCLATGSAASGVLCADGHLGYAHPIGGVVGYTDHISISGVGFDIACGNMAVRLDTRYADIKEQASAIMRDVAKHISFGIGRKNAERVDHDLFDSDLWLAAEVGHLKEMARAQLGTVGSGNHYVDLFEDEEGFVWIGVHFGSRGLGHKTTTKYLELAGARDGMEVDPALLDVNSDLGRGYIAGVELGGLYAYAGREWVVEKVRSIIGGAVTFSVHNHHNFVWRETHGGVDMWVVRKGATPAFPGQMGFVGGSMGDDAVILRGVESEASKASLYSTVHGAGRVMSRTRATGQTKSIARCTAKDCLFEVSWRGFEHARKEAGLKHGAQFTLCPDHPGTTMRKLKLRSEGAIRHDEMKAWVQEKGVILIGAGVDEAPQAYRRLPEVLAAHAGTVEIMHRLRPFGVVMAGENEFDPFKD
ncbi:RtcB family protein [Aestuariivirga sp.]|uniref:RtcB family protein n=1 Tax=Aestuariivirga sp. TaxID=2650926 RepID=UPI0039E3A5B4